MIGLRVLRCADGVETLQLSNPMRNLDVKQTVDDGVVVCETRTATPVKLKLKLRSGASKISFHKPLAAMLGPPS